MRLIVRIVIVGLGLMGVGLAVLLVPPHVQTRRIAPPLPGLADLRALSAQSDGPVSVEYLVNASQVSPRGTLGHTVFLARWADGRSFMIDAGMDRAAAAEFAELLKWMWGADEGRFHGDVSNLLGDDIRCEVVAQRILGQHILDPPGKHSAQPRRVERERTDFDQQAKSRLDHSGRQRRIHLS